MTVKQINLEILMDLHVISTPEYEKVVSGILFVLLAPG
jgi:hypothetical protein